MLGLQTFKKLLDWVRKSLVCYCLRHPASVAAGRWDREEGEYSDSGCLVFVRYVGMVTG
jgi:hypothetical protein